MKLNLVEKKTFFLIMLSAFFNGFVFSAFQIQDIIAKKALHAVDWQITILVMLWPISNLFSIWWGKILEHSRSLSKYFVLAAIVGRLTLVFMLWIHNYYQYLALLILLFSFNAFISPAQNSIFQTNIRPRNRGILFGYFSSLITLTAIIFSFIAGKMLDVNEQWFRYIFLIIGVFGCFSSLIMAQIKTQKESFDEKAFLTLKHVFIKPIQRTLEVLRINKDFAVFQRNFFLYGIGFMIILPAIPVYLVDFLKMDYTQTFLAKGVIAQVGILFFAPLAGKIFDKRHPAFFSSLCFGCLGFYPLILFISSFLLEMSFVNLIVYSAFLFFGIAMSAVHISWNMSSIFFAGKEDASMYQSVHVSLTGLRGIFAPFLGFLILRFFGVRTVFCVSKVMFFLASFLSYKHYIKMKNRTG